jgi:hypothetical protein
VAFTAGFSLASASSLCCSPVATLGCDQALVAQIGVMGGFVLGRTVGITLGGAPNLFIATLLTGEVFMVAVALVAMRQLNRHSSITGDAAGPTK